MALLGERGVFQMENNQIGFIDLLTAEHKALRRALNILRTMTDRVERGISTDRHDVNALLIFFHYFGDVLHQGKEESILFPALKSSNEFTSFPELEGLLVEHNEERALIETAQFTLFTDKQDEFIASARKLIDLLSEHAVEEERVLFPLADKILKMKMAKANEVSEKLQHADAQFGLRQRKLLMDMLQELEDRYMGKAA
jgi:hemerythrin-like domain-containing protein